MAFAVPLPCLTDLAFFCFLREIHNVFSFWIHRQSLGGLSKKYVRI